MTPSFGVSCLRGAFPTQSLLLDASARGTHDEVKLTILPHLQSPLTPGTRAWIP